MERLRRSLEQSGGKSRVAKTRARAKAAEEAREDRCVTLSAISYGARC